MRAKIQRYVQGATAALVFGCAPCYDSYEPNYTNYSVHRTGISSLEYGLDDPKGELDRVRLDKIVEDVKDCVAAVLPLTPQEQQEGECMGTPTPEIRSCLTVKDAPDWHWGCNNQEQLFGSAPIASCEAKGLTPTADCPCEFRAIIQDNCTVITTPNMKILAGQLTTLFTGCTNAWTGRLLTCAKISLEE